MDALANIPLQTLLGCGFALALAFGFEFINGFHDTANAVTTVIYTHSLKARWAVLYSGLFNFIGVLAGGTAVAFSIVHLLPVELLISANTKGALAMTLSLLIAGVIWNLGTWYFGLPVSSSHTLIGSILGVGIVNSLLTRGNVSGVNWEKASEVMLSLLISPVIGFVAAAILLRICRAVVPDRELYEPPKGEKPPPRWIRGILLLTCGGVSFAHGSNDGQKGMGLVLLVLIGFLPGAFALNVHESHGAERVYNHARGIRRNYAQNHQLMPKEIEENVAIIESNLHLKQSLSELAPQERWGVRQAIYSLTSTRTTSAMTPTVRSATAANRGELRAAVEYVPFWVVLGVALALGCGTMIGYERIVVTVAEKIGKHHLAYAQGGSAEVTTMLTILMATQLGMPVSTTHVLSSGIAGTMWANESGIQSATVVRIATAWTLTLPMSMAISGGLYFPVSQLFR